MASKIKKLLKKVGKAALLGGGAYMAAKGLSNAKNKKLLGETEDGKSSFAKFLKPSIGMVTDGSNQKMPSNLSRSAGATGPKKRNMYGPGDGLDSYMAKGGRAVKKSKPKSIGKALRGGGKVMR